MAKSRQVRRVEARVKAWSQISAKKYMGSLPRRERRRWARLVGNDWAKAAV